MKLTPDEQASFSRLLGRPVNDQNGHALIVATVKELQRLARSKKLSINVDEMTDVFQLDGVQVATTSASPSSAVGKLRMRNPDSLAGPQPKHALSGA